MYLGSDFREKTSRVSSLPNLSTLWKGFPMAQEKKILDNKVRLLESAENIRYMLAAKKRKNVSFYEGFAILLSNGYLDSEIAKGENGQYIN